jgi:hypothetical protein
VGRSFDEKQNIGKKLKKRYPNFSHNTVVNNVNVLPLSEVSAK